MAAIFMFMSSLRSWRLQQLDIYGAAIVFLVCSLRIVRVNARESIRRSREGQNRQLRRLVYVLICNFLLRCCKQLGIMVRKKKIGCNIET